MNPQTKNRLAIIREQIREGRAIPPTPEFIKARRAALNIGKESLARAAMVTKSTIQAVEDRGQASPEMLVWLERTMNDLIWNPVTESYAIKRGNQVIDIHKRIPAGNGWRRHSLDLRERDQKTEAAAA
jgi:hypothetical protein